jgi:uncharacterized protein YneF (UPF0154 family)
MSPAEEKKFLSAALKDLERSGGAWSWRAYFLELLAIAGIGLIGFWVSKAPGNPDWLIVLFLVVAFLSGLILGCLSLWRSLYRKGTLIRPYIDQDRIRARLVELEA